MADRQVATREVTGDGNALALIKQYQAQGALVFAAPEDLRTQRMFLPELVVLHATDADFHSMPRGQYMPKSHHAHRMADAAGVVFTANCGTRPGEREYARIGFAQGKKRLPDGTWRESPVMEYEFDPDVRAEEDFLNDKEAREPKYTTDVAKRRHLLELRKFATARASTGAELRVIRYLTGTPCSFSKPDMARAMVFSRIALNSDAMLDSPELRDAAIAHALGAEESIFGPKAGPVGERNVTPQATRIAAPEEPDPFADLVTSEPASEKPTEPTPEQIARGKLEEWLQADAIRKHPTAPALIRGLLEVPDASLESLEKMIARCAALEARRGGAA
jgi:hypothetical protein